MVKQHLLFGLLVRHNAVYVIALPINIVIVGPGGLTLIPHFFRFTTVY